MAAIPNLSYNHDSYTLSDFWPPGLVEIPLSVDGDVSWNKCRIGAGLCMAQLPVVDVGFVSVPQGYDAQRERYGAGDRHEPLGSGVVPDAIWRIALFYVGLIACGVLAVFVDMRWQRDRENWVLNYGSLLAGDVGMLCVIYFTIGIRVFQAWGWLS